MEAAKQKQLEAEGGRRLEAATAPEEISLDESASKEAFEEERLEDEPPRPPEPWSNIWVVGALADEQSIR